MDTKMAAHETLVALPARRNRTNGIFPLVSILILLGHMAAGHTHTVESFQVDAAAAAAAQSVMIRGVNGTLTNENSYPSEVARLWSDLSSLEESLAAITVTSESNSTALSSNNISSHQAMLGALNGTQQHYVGDDDPLIMSINLANIIIFVTGFCGNSLVILVILKFTRIETVTDIYILNLAFADFMFLFGLVFLILTMFIDHWVFGNIMCKLYMASTSLNQFASSLLLVVMSFDRFLAVCHPIYAQRFRRLRRAKVICLCIWIMCLILMTPIFVFARTNTYPMTNENTTCAIIWPEYKSFNCEIAFTLYSFAIGFAFPLLLIAAFYTCVIKRLRVAASGTISMGSSRRSRSRESTNRRIEHLVIGIITTYTICWLPYWISQLVVSFNTTFGKEPTKEPFQAFYPFVLIATCLSYTNSALNPILYAFLSDNFKRRCSDVFRSITSMNWCGHRTPATDTHSTVATGLCEHSEINNNNNNNNLGNSHHLRPESRQTVVMNESVQLVTSPSQLGDILATSSEMFNINNNGNGNGNHHNTTTTTTTTTTALGGVGGRAATLAAGVVEDAEDQDLARQHMIGSKLAKLHNSLSCEAPDDKPPPAASAAVGDHLNASMARDKHCFTNHQGQHGADKAPDQPAGSLSLGESRERLNSTDCAIGRAMGVYHDPTSARKRSVAFSADMIVVRKPGDNTGGGGGADQIAKGDHKMATATNAASRILHAEPVDWKHQQAHCQEAV